MTEENKAQEDNCEVLSPDELIERIGGCGRYQIRMSIVVHLIKTIANFSVSNLIIFSAAPLWYCSSGHAQQNSSLCFDEVFVSQTNNSAEYCQDMNKNCHVDNHTECKSFDFDHEFHSFTSEFDLVCSNDFIPDTINSMNMVGALVGCLVGGQLADLFGRKPPFFASVVIYLVFHLMGYFATSWEMFAVVAVLTGMGNGFFLTIQYSILSEYSLAECRVWMVGFPSWPLQRCLFALLAWLIHDWRYMQLLTSLLAIPALMTWRTIPESFRWYLGHDRGKEAQEMFNKVAKFNKAVDKEINLEKVLQKPENQDDKKKYTFLHLFKTRKLTKMTLLLIINWAALDISSSGISFGIKTLAGNIYLNFFLFSIVAVPSKFIAIKLQNRFGRRTTTILCYSTTAVSGLLIGIVNTLDLSNKDVITNVLAFTANAGVAATWGPLQTMTLEMYPTVIRNIGFGALSVVGKMSGVLGPQLAYLNSIAPGLLFYVCGGMSLLGALGTILLPETKDLGLQDKIGEEAKKKSDTEKEIHVFTVSEEVNTK